MYKSLIVILLLGLHSKLYCTDLNFDKWSKWTCSSDTIKFKDSYGLIFSRNKENRRISGSVIYEQKILIFDMCGNLREKVIRKYHTTCFHGNITDEFKILNYNKKLECYQKWIYKNEDFYQRELLLSF